MCRGVVKSSARGRGRDSRVGQRGAREKETEAEGARERDGTTDR